MGDGSPSGTTCLGDGVVNSLVLPCAVVKDGSTRFWAILGEAVDCLYN